MFAEGLIIHKKVDDRIRSIRMMEPSGKFPRCERVFGPFPVGIAEGDIIGERIVSQQEFQLAAPRRPVKGMAASSGKNSVSAFRQNRLEIHLFDDFGQVIVIDQFCMTKGLRRLAEKRLNLFFMEHHLVFEFLQGE